MSKLPILKWDNPASSNAVLQQVCRPVEGHEFGSDLKRLMDDMFETIDGIGLGLAGPQVGQSLRILVMVRTAAPGDFRGPIALCNPLWKPTSSATNLADEGCLSLPDVRNTVKRYTQVAVQYRDPLGHPHELVLDGLDARVLQHECDHLDGIMLFDRVPKLIRSGLLRKYRKLLLRG